MALNCAVVLAIFALTNVTVPGPLTFVQSTDRVLPGGTPSSVAEPFKVTLFVGREIVWSGPALTDGGWLDTTVTVISSEVLNSESLAVNRSTYVPSTLNVAVVCAWLALAKITAPGPLICCQFAVIVLPRGKPSSLITPLSVIVFVGRTRS